MRSTPELAVVADDLSGAAECAAHGLLRVSRSVPLRLLATTDGTTTAAAVADGSARVVVVDTDARTLDDAAARDRVRAAGDLVSGACVVVQKVDSLLRGNVAGEVAALAERLGRTPVIAVANPALGRTVTGGVLHVGGAPLHETTLWAVEPTPPPTSIAEALRTMRTALVPLDAVRGEVATLTDALRQAVAEGCAPVCDARDDADLDAVVAAAQTAFGTPLLVGSGALTAAAVRALPGPGGDGAPAEASRPDASAGPGSFPGLPHVGSLLMVLGTRTDTVAAQLDEVSPLATSQLLVDPTMLLSDPAAVRSEVEALGREGLALVALDPAAPADPTASTRIVAALADAVAAVADGFDAVFLAGGQTARAVLDRLGTDALEVVASLGSGTVVSLRRTTDGVTTPTRVVVTRPGSFGDADALRHVAEQLLATAAPLPARPASSLPAENDSPHPPSRTRATPEENR